MEISLLDADTIRKANKIIKEKKQEMQYYQDKAQKGDTMADIKYDRANKEITEAQNYMDKICKKYQK